MMPRIDESLAKHTKLAAYFLGFICFVLVVYILTALQEILIPVTIAIFLTYLFHPLIIYFKKFKIPKWVSLILILVFIFGVYYLVGLILVSSFSTFPEKLKVYSNNISHFLAELLAPFNITLQELSEMLEIKIREFDITSIFQGLFEAGIIQNLFNSFSSLLGDFFIAMIFWIFMILGKSRFEERLKVAFSDRRELVERNLKRINVELQSYIIIKTVLSFITGVIATIILWAYGIDFAVVWGMLTFILNYIPNIGSIIATVFPILVSLLEHGLGLTTISLTALLLVNQSIIGNLIEPHYLGRHMDLSPVFVLFSLIFWGWVWGIVGMFLAVPIAAAMKILFSNIEPLKPVAVIMGSKAKPLATDLTGPEKVIKGDDN